MTAIQIVAICFGIIMVAVFALVAIAIRNYDPDADAVHRIDCLDWRSRGIRDMDCPAHHGTDWFAPTRAQVELENELDGQLSIGPDRHGTA